MNKHSSLRSSGSLLERASEMYDFRSALRRPDQVEAPPPMEPLGIAPAVREPVHFEPAASVAAQAPVDVPRRDDPAASRPADLPPPERTIGTARVDRETLRGAGFVLPETAESGIAEEFRIIKRQLLLATGGKTGIAEDKRQTILVCSGRPDEGKTFCAVNLALSLASERDVEVLLVDGDFAKPEVLSILGLEGGAGLTDAIGDLSIDPETLVIRTDIEGLSVLPAGRHANNVTELLASERTRQVLTRLTSGHPRRIIIFDSPPALVASPASVLAALVGQVLMVVRADQTVESDLREAIGLLSGCEHVSLMLNATGFAAGSSRFGSYYGTGQ